MDPHQVLGRRGQRYDSLQKPDPSLQIVTMLVSAGSGVEVSHVLPVAETLVRMGPAQSNGRLRHDHRPCPLAHRTPVLY